MTNARTVRVAVAFARQAAAAPPAHLCSACVDILDVSGVGITLMTGHSSSPVCSSNDRAGVLDDLQFALGEGPCRDAFASGKPVIETDLGGTATDRWPNFAPQALDAGARAVFAFPLHAGGRDIGVLTLHQLHAGALTGEQAIASLLVADVLAETMLTVQSRTAPDVLAESLTDAGAHRAEVHQASGMVVVQLAISVPDALARLQAHAFATDQTVIAVARDVVTHRRRFDA